MNNQASLAHARVDEQFQAQSPQWVVVIGVLSGGFEELGRTAREMIEDANLILGSWRQLNLLPDNIVAEKRPWPSPLVPALPRIFAESAAKKIVVLASGDPMFHGIGNTLRRVLPELDFSVISAPSSVSLACAELGWAVHHTPVYSLVTEDTDHLHLAIDQAQPFLVLGRNEHSPQDICDLLVERDAGQSKVVVLSDLGGADAHISEGTAAAPPAVSSALNIIAVKPSASARTLVSGLDEAHYDHDGQITKRHVRALSVSALQPIPGHTLWDIGGGSGSIAIEYLRASSNTQAVCFESNPERQARILANSARLGVNNRLSLAGKAPDAITEASSNPDRIFIGGGLTRAGVFETAWERLKPHGILVANAVTLETQARLWQLRRDYGGELTQIQIAHEHSIGSFHALEPALPVLQWIVEKNA